MAYKDAQTLKSYFRTGDKPTETQWGNLIDSIFRAVLLNPGAETLVLQALSGYVRTDGDTMTGRLTLPSLRFNANATAAYNDGNVILDFAGANMQTLTIPESIGILSYVPITVSTTNNQSDSYIALRIIGNSTQETTINMPIENKAIRELAPLSIWAGGSAILSVYAFGPTAADVYYCFGPQAQP